MRQREEIIIQKIRVSEINNFGFIVGTVTYTTLLYCTSLYCICTVTNTYVSTNF